MEMYASTSILLIRIHAMNKDPYQQAYKIQDFFIFVNVKDANAHPYETKDLYHKHHNPY